MSKEKRMGRPPIGDKTGKRLNLYLTEPREQLFEESYNLLVEKGLLNIDIPMQRSRTEIVDFALQALIRQLKED